jgi:hypothetical protein
MMHEHAKSIYRAALDGKTVQAKTKEGWKDDDPFRCSFHPIDFPLSWRIKPETKTLFYKVYFCLNSLQPKIFIDDGTDLINEFEKHDSFGGWMSILQRAHF